MFIAVTSLSNWLVREMLVRDVVKHSDQDRMPPMPLTYLYPQARVLFPTVPSTTVASLERSIKQKYKAKRFNVLWRNIEALPTFRYPQPFTVPNKNWTAKLQTSSRDEKVTYAKTPVILVRIGDQRFELRLKGGLRYRRQLHTFSSIVLETSVPCELSLYQRDSVIYCRMVAWILRNEQSSQVAFGKLSVRTSPDEKTLLLAVNTRDESIWRYNADHVRRWSAEHRARLRRLSEDAKAEERPIPAFDNRRTQIARKYRDRIDSAADQVASYLVRYAKRRHLLNLEYDDSDQSWLPEFVWFRLRERISMLCDEYGIRFSRIERQEKSQLPNP